jgi:pimeloyl-ACP methyl ester carboxylesterase
VSSAVPTSGASIVPFRIAVSAAELEDLQRRLATVRWPPEAPGAGWEDGVPLGYLRELAEYWRTTYDWRRHEARLNSFAQFTTEIDGARVHFLHVRSAEPDALPLIVTHGWPGSIAEFIHVIGPLADPRAHGGDPGDAFHVVAPSIPGYGFSGPTRAPGWDVARVARAWAELMSRLGYQRYGAQGGDWGSAVSQQLARVAAGHIVGLHLNLLMTAQPAAGPGPADLSGADHRAAQSLIEFRTWRSGYQLVNATQSQTLAYALTDSPVGQLAWIVDKMMEWSAARHAPEEAVDRDLILTNVMLYWLTRTAGSSARLYKTLTSAQPPATRIEAPTAVAVFPSDIAQPVRAWAQQQANVVRWTEFEHGGHFAALEAPNPLVHDIRAFFRRLRR